MDENKTIIILTGIAFVISIFAIGVSYLSINNLVSEISGLVTTGETNLTVETQAQINFTQRALNFGSGRVNAGASAASIFVITSSASITGGNWTYIGDQGFVIENIGNTNLTLNLSVGKNASEFIGGTNPVYEMNLSNLEAASCRNIAGTGDSIRMNTFFEMNTTSINNGGGLGCAVFRFESANDRIHVSLNLTIPENSLTGALGDVLTATATAL